MFDGAPKRKTVRVADLFCGAGGTAKGAQRALERRGYAMELVAINHDATAIASHAENFPQAQHYISDVNAVRPLGVVPEGWLDLLMASPTCTHHSRARGGRPTSDQQRIDPWAVVTWLSSLRVKRLLCENVPEFVDWGPVDRRTGKPIAARKGDYFRAWLRAIEDHGFKAEWRILNCADYGDPTTRVRWFLMARSDGRKIRWPAPTHAPRAKAELLGLLPWRAARGIIDWTIPGRSIFDRARPLSINTLRRIEAGIRKFGWPSAFLVVLRQHMDAVSADAPVPTIAAQGNHIGLAEARPFAFPLRGAGYLVEPFVATVAHGVEAREGDPHSRRCRALDEPLQAIHAGGGKFGLVEPFMLSRHAGAPRSVEEPTPTRVARHSHLLVEPAPLVAPYYGSGSGATCKTVDEPLDTVTSRDRFGLVTPITHSDGSNRARDIDEPLPTITTAHRGELAFVTAAFGERPGQAPRVHSIDEPCPTICAEGRIPLVAGVEPPTRAVDILFRMFEPHEFAGAMSLADHKFLGTKTQKTKQIGNAVPGETAAALVGALFGDAP
jgi:DNA (cytosine-5)-methyltransferase 1